MKGKQMSEKNDLNLGAECMQAHLQSKETFGDQQSRLSIQLEGTGRNWATHVMSWAEIRQLQERRVLEKKQIKNSTCPTCGKILLDPDGFHSK